MGFRHFFRLQMPKRVDHVVGRIDLFPDGEIGHIADKRRFWKTRSLQPGIAVFDGLFVQIISSDFVTRLGELGIEFNRNGRNF